MDEVPGSLGTSASFSLRLGQTLFASASLLFMSLGVDFYSYTAFWHLTICYAFSKLAGNKMTGRKIAVYFPAPNDDQERGQTVHTRNATLLLNIPGPDQSIGSILYTFYLVTIMSLVIPWSLTLALVDGYSVLVKCPVRQPGILLIIVFGDWVLSILTLAAACSTVSVVDLLLHFNGSYCPPKLCSRYQISAAMAFLSWFMSLASALFNLWLLPSL